VNWLTERGRNWLKKKAEPKKEETAGLIKTSGSDLKSARLSKWASRSLLLKNKMLEHENQELNSLLGLSWTVYRKCSSERDYIGWKYFSSMSEFERKNEKLQSLAGLLEAKDKIIFDFRQQIGELNRSPKLPERSFSPKRKDHVEFKVPSMRKLNIPPRQKKRAMSLKDIILECLEEGLRLRSWHSVMDRWLNWLPEPKGGGYKWDIFWDVTKAYYDELKSVKKPRKISKSSGCGNEVPPEILRLPY
jgi:hypothetical protein